MLVRISALISLTCSKNPGFKNLDFAYIWGAAIVSVKNHILFCLIPQAMSVLLYYTCSQLTVTTGANKYLKANKSMHPQLVINILLLSTLFC